MNPKNPVGETHKPGCMANTKCLVYHQDGICPGPYGICNCKAPMTTEKEVPEWEESWKWRADRMGLDTDQRDEVKDFIKEAVSSREKEIEEAVEELDWNKDSTKKAWIRRSVVLSIIHKK